MSRVFLATETALDRQVVIKVLPPETVHDVSAERFAREVRLSSQLQHPNIVPILTAGDADGIAYYTMPFVDGESLRAELARLAPDERLPLPRALNILRDIARALAYAHDQGIVHRDIKPENVLLAFDAAVVADFGVAKATAAARRSSGPGGNATLTQGGVSLGTPAYMSPEQAAGDPVIDHRADIYAWGIVAYELLSGAHPFAAHTSVQTLVRAHLMEQPRPLGEFAPHLPASLAALVMRCLAKSPAERPGSGRDLLDALAAPTTTRHRTPARVAFAVVALATIVGLTWLARGWSGGNATSDGPAAADVTPYDTYLRGKVRVSSENPADNEAAIAILREAVAADPQFAPAIATLARAFAVKAFYFAADSERKAVIEDAEVAVAKAMALAPRLAEAHYARGLLLWTPTKRFPHEQAISAYRQALAIDSTLDDAHHQLGVIYFHLGLLDKAESEIHAALAINPGNTLARFRLGVIAMYRGRFVDADKVFSSTPLGSNPALWAFQQATALYRLGRAAEAAALIDTFLRDFPRDEGGVGHSVRAMILAKAGRRAEAETAIAQTLERGQTFGHFHHSAYNIASAYVMLGRHDDAIRWLTDATQNGFPCYPLFATDTQLDGLRGDPRFQALLAGLKRDWEARQKAL